MNGALVSTVIRSLALTVGGGNASQSSALWRDSWTRRGPAQSKEGNETDGETNEVKQTGLRYKKSLEAHGMIWLPSDLFNWDTWPIFTLQSFEDLAVYRNAFQKSFKHMPDIQKKLGQENRFFVTYRSFFSRAKQYPWGLANFDREREYAIDLGAELIVQESVKDVFSLLASRFECNVKNESARKTILLKPLDEDKANGLIGLDYGTLEALLPGVPICHAHPQIERAIYMSAWPIGLHTEEGTSLTW